MISATTYKGVREIRYRTIVFCRTGRHRPIGSFADMLQMLECDKFTQIDYENEQ
jgi:hypothetical protein